MNILLITTISGFLPKFLMQDVRILQELGHIVHYASNFDNPIYECDREALEQQGIICHQIPIAKSPLAIGANLSALRQLNKITAQKDIQAVHCHNPMGGVLGRMIRTKGRKLYVIYTAHGFHFYKGAELKNWIFYYSAERLLAHRTNQLITINREDKLLADTFRLRKDGRVSRIPGVGLDSRWFNQDSEERLDIRKRLGIERDEYLFLSVGELNGNKNHRTIIEAFSRLQNEKAKLYICGEGKLRRELERLIQELDLTGKAVLCGYQNGIENYYQAADCFLFPSIREGLGMAALEAMASGLPVIAGDNRGTREYMLKNGIVCRPRDRKAFADAMQSIMENPQRSARMAVQSRKIAAGFTTEKTAEVMRQVYERMAEEVEGADK